MTARPTIWLGFCRRGGGAARGEEIVHDLADTALLPCWHACAHQPGYPDDCRRLAAARLQITLEENGALTVHEHQLLKLLTEQALPRANWQIPYDKSCETLHVPVARTLLNGIAFPVDPQQMVESALYPGLAWYDALVVRRFPLPAASVGATLEVETVLHRAVPRMPDDFSTRLQLAGCACRLSQGISWCACRCACTSPSVSAENNSRRSTRGQAWVSELRLVDPACAGTAHHRAVITAARTIWSIRARITCRQSWEPVVAWYSGLTAGKDRLSEALRQAAATAPRDAPRAKKNRRAASKRCASCRMWRWRWAT